MQNIFLLSVWAVVGVQSIAVSSTNFYPSPETLKASPGNATYFVDPKFGDDARSGATRQQAWRSIAKINALRLAPGDKIVIAPGLHEQTLKPSGEGSTTQPIVVQFLPGVHTFAVEDAVRLPMFVSNSCDDPKTPKPIGILVQNVKHLRVEGGGVDGEGKTTILYAGRMVEIFNDHSEDITYAGLAFDLKRPTVSEFRVLDFAADNATIQVAEGSDYGIENGRFVWKGDIGIGSTMVQQAIPATGECHRMGLSWNPLTAAEKAEDLGGRRVRLHWKSSNYGLRTGQQYQFRRITRDSVAVHSARCKGIVLRDCDFYALTNMGIVSQFTENITFQRVNVAPPINTIRTCPAWADVFQFSNCRGDILVDSCRMSGMQDDAVNCHGTHLRILARPAANQFLVRFMHPQTYGFAAYVPGDEVAVIKHSTLREYDNNPRRRVVAVEGKGPYEWVITLDGPVPSFDTDDVLDNITWYPNFTATNNVVDTDSCRGFLITTRGKVLVENNAFRRCAMQAILVEDDAEGWFESGPVRDMTIRNNRFLGCGIDINPQTHSKKPEEPVHENIRIEDNSFDGAGVNAHNVRGLIVNGNRPARGLPLNIDASCTQVRIEPNRN